MIEKTRSAACWLFFLLFTAPLFASNPVQLENQKAGDPNWVLYSEATTEIEGYASATSVNRGEQISFYVSTTDPQYTIEIYRMGWYGGVGARRVLGPVTRNGFQQVKPAPNATTGIVECDWTDPYTITIPNSSDPTDWCSGVYLVRLSATSANKQRYIPFVVRDDARISNHYFQRSVTTDEAYNAWGGKSLYGFNSTGKVPATQVSFNRPFGDNAGTGTFLWGWEYNMVRYLEREGFDVTYCTNIDTARRGNLIRNHHDFLSVGHDEYWSWDMRANVEAARDAGINLAFFGGNDCYWQIRLAPSTINSAQADRTIIGYKEQYTKDPYYTDRDSTNDKYVTTNWRGAPVRKPEDAMIGTLYVYDSGDPNNKLDSDIVIDDTTSMPWLFSGTGLQQGSHLVGLLGYEVDAIGANTPANVVRLGHSPFTNNKISPPATQYSDMTIYTAASGALVFSAGSIQFAWGLDDWNESTDRTSPAVQQFVHNLLWRYAGADSGRDCQITLSPTSIQVGTAAGSSTFNVNAGCSWSATSSASWLTVTHVGNGSVTYAWSANSGPARQATITVADKTFTVTQSSACATSISPSSASFDRSGGSGSISITLPSTACTWTASTNVAWVTLGASSGSGSSALTYSVAPNSSTGRSGTITINDQTFTVSQTSGCAYSVSPMSFNFGPNAGSGSVTLSTDSACFWAAESHSSWITMTGTTDSRGPTTVPFTVAANPDVTSRTGYIIVAGSTIFITQNGIPTTASFRAREDFDADGKSDIFWRHDSGVDSIWLMNGASPTMVSTQSVADAGWQPAGVGDFDGDGRADVFWHHQTAGANAVWLMNGANVKQSALTVGVDDLNWQPVGFGDFNGDGVTDVFWRRSVSGANAIWLMNGIEAPKMVSTLSDGDPNWQPAAFLDVNGDGKTDVLWRHVTSPYRVALWIMNGTGPSSVVYLPDTGTVWQVLGSGDFDGDHKGDIFWRNSSTGQVVIWFMDGTTVRSMTNVTTVDPKWVPRVFGDFNGDGKCDVFWRHETGATSLWQMNGATPTILSPPGVSDLKWVPYSLK